MDAFSLITVKDQPTALKWLTKQAARDVMSPIVRNAAIKIVRDCAARDDVCELKAIFRAVKYGDKQVRGLENGVKYMADPYFVDTFIAPSDLLAECEDGACAADCDDHGALCFALAGSLGFRVGLRAWGPKNSSGYAHVYAVALLPKEDDDGDGTITEYGLDTSADVGDDDTDGWQPPAGNVLTAWLEEGDVPSDTARAKSSSAAASFAGHRSPSSYRHR